jgi:thiamine-phosphate pyrophosphorylase
VVWTYYITDRKCCTVPLIENIRFAIEAGVDFIQIREKDLSGKELYDLAVHARRVASGHQVKILMNDRLDVALSARLDGVHLGQQSLPPGEIRRVCPSHDFIVGVSTHNLEEVDRLRGQDISFITFGPVFLTPSKAAYGAPVGLQALQEATRCTNIPVLALGGINRQNYRDCLTHGATGIAAIRLFQAPAIPLREIVRDIQGFPRQ